MLSTAEKAARIRSFVTAFNNHDPIACAAFFAENATTTTAAGVQVQGRKAIEALYRGQFTSFPDTRVEPLKAVVAGEQVFAEYNLEGTHLGPLTFAGKEIAPTGRPFKVQYLATFTFNPAGELTTLIQTGDTMALLRQLQIVPPPHVTEEKIAGIVEELVAAINQKDLNRLATCFAPDAVFGSQTMGQIHGREAIRESFGRTLNAYPNMQQRVTAQAIQDNTAVVTLAIRATQTGSLAGREATNREVDFELTFVAEVGPTGIFACRQYVDGIKMAKQLGFLPE